MDPTSQNLDLNSLRSNAQTTSDQSSKLQESIPGLLSGLKSNLTSIFTKDNPMFAQREDALKTFLDAPSQTRSNLLPGNLPTVEGSPLNLSPTQQNAIVESRRNAALVPLAGLNQSIVGQYGNILDMLQNAGSLYQTQAQLAKERAANALGIYKAGIDQYTAAKPAAGSGIGSDLSSLIAALYNQQSPRPALSSFDQPDQISFGDTPPGSPLDLTGAISSGGLSFNGANPDIGNALLHHLSFAGNV